MNEVENEDLVFTLETIVDKFGEEMAPYALGLCQNLVMLICLLMSLLTLLFWLCVLIISIWLSGCCILEMHEYC